MVLTGKRGNFSGLAYLANYGAIALELMFGRCLASPSQWDTRHGAIIRCNRYPLIPLTGGSYMYYLGVQRCDRHKHWRRSTATPAPSYLPLIGVELTIAECTRLAITETGPRLGAVIRDEQLAISM